MLYIIGFLQCYLSVVCTYYCVMLCIVFLKIIGL